MWYVIIFKLYARFMLLYHRHTKNVTLFRLGQLVHCNATVLTEAIRQHYINCSQDFQSWVAYSSSECRSTSWKMPKSKSLSTLNFQHCKKKLWHYGTEQNFKQSHYWTSLTNVTNKKSLDNGSNKHKCNMTNL